MRRNHAIDLLRGLVMILMVLDHSRDFMSNVSFKPTDLTQTTGLLFFTRWITHYCAPVFVLLSGTSAYLSSARQKGTKELVSYLATRGLWLILLELTWIRCTWEFNFDFTQNEFGVIWAIGWSMLALAAVVALPVQKIAAIGFSIVAFHNLLDGIHASDLGSFAPFWLFLHESGAYAFGNIKVMFLYPVLPWVGVIFLGYSLGYVLEKWGEEKNYKLIPLGLGLCFAFILVRSINIYGDLYAWSLQSDALMTVLSFLNTTKYPPSLDYLLMTLGPAMVLLGLFAKIENPPRVLLAFGRVPLFFYLVHIPMIHLLAHVAVAVSSGTSVWEFGIRKPAGVGFGLLAVYLTCAFVIFCLYPLSKWFGKLKMQKAHPFLRFL